MNRKRIVITSTSAVLLALIVVFLGYLWVIDGYYHPVVWESAGGQLQLNYQPGKDNPSIIVNQGYVRSEHHVWTVVYPGATQRWLGAPKIPPVEELFRRARIPMGKSDPVGLCNLYGALTDEQKRDVISDLKDACQRSAEVRKALRQLFATGRYPWLLEVI